MSKYKRTKIEKILLDIENELIEDVRKIKKKSDPKSHRNKYMLSFKINAIYNERMRLALLRGGIKEFALKFVPINNMEIIKFQRKIFKLIKDHMLKAAKDH